MAIDFDVLLPDVQAAVNALAPGGASVTALTLPMASAPLPLTAGRTCIARLEIVGADSSGNSIYEAFTLVVQGGSPPSVVATTGVDTGPASQLGFATVIVSGDLEIQVANNNGGGSGITMDLSVRVMQRMVGA